MATGSRTLWKGAIAFGLVHIPVSLHTATAGRPSIDHYMPAVAVNQSGRWCGG